MVLVRWGCSVALAPSRSPVPPALGSTQTKAEGSFDLVVNGGGALHVVFTADGYLPVDRELVPLANAFEPLRDVLRVCSGRLRAYELRSAGRFRSRLLPIPVLGSCTDRGAQSSSASFGKNRRPISNSIASNGAIRAVAVSSRTPSSTQTPSRSASASTARSSGSINQ
jgi:hypothetical protein